MSSPSAPNLPPSLSLGDPAVVLRLLAKAVERSTVATVLFRLADFHPVYLNGRARQLLDPGAGIDWKNRPAKLPDMIGPTSIDLFQSQIRSHLNVLGRWHGPCELVDTLGNKVQSVATFSRLDSPPDPSYVCLQALTPAEVLPRETRSFITDQDLLHALLNHLPDSIYFKDKSSRFVRVSKSMAAHFGRSSPKDLIGRTDFDFFTAEHAAPAFSDEQHIVKTGQPILDKEEKEIWPDGRVTWAASTKLPLCNLEGQTIGTFGVSRDITARKRAESERRELELQLQLAHKLESIGMLAAGVAHEINTPTHFVSDNISFLQDACRRYADIIKAYRSAMPSCPPAEQARIAALETSAEIDYYLGEVPKALAESVDGLGRITRIVKSLKEFSHPNSTEHKPADINQAIQTTIAVARHEWKYVAEVATDLDPDLPLVPCILDQFNQVILNLIVNAAHAIEDALRKTGTKQGTITLRTRRDGDFALIEVADTGTGIPPEVQPRIFELFFTTKPSGRGTGQGLALVQTITQRHGGTVDFVTAVGQGTTFRVHLPLNPGAVADHTHPAA